MVRPWVPVEETPGGGEEKTDGDETAESERIFIETGRLHQELKIVQAEEYP
jgi:hypothetical protein